MLNIEIEFARSTEKFEVENERLLTKLRNEYESESEVTMIEVKANWRFIWFEDWNRNRFARETKNSSEDESLSEFDSRNLNSLTKLSL